MRRRRKLFARKRALSLMQDNIGLAFGLRNSRMEGRLAEEASEYLRTHTELFKEQMDDIRRNEVGDILSVVLQVFSVIVGLSIAAFLAVAVWQAVHSKTLVMEPISAPEDFQKNGLTPSVLSAQLLDQLRVMQSQTDSARAPGTFASNWTEDIEVEIPQTGMSIGEALKILRRWLGKDIRISGEIWKTGTQGLAMTARAGDSPGQIFRNDGGQLEPLMQQAAQSIYARTQPYRYSVYLWQNDRPDEAIRVLQALSEDGPKSERAWAYVGLGGMYGARSNLRLASATARKGLALNPHLASGWKIVADSEYSLGRAEPMLAAYRAQIEALDRSDGGGVTETAGAQNRLDARATIAEALGDWRGAAAILAGADTLDDYQASAATASTQESIYRIMAHQPVDPWKVALDPEDEESPVSRARLVAAAASARDDWRGVGEALARIQAEAAKAPGADYRAQMWPGQVWPLQAYAYAREGDFARARRLVAATPLDCYLCLRARAWIEAAAGDREAAEVWFAAAVKAGPSLPFAYGEWGRALATWGDHRAAAARFKQAIRKGNAWPEARLWHGQSLLAQGKRREAAERFSEASQLAPQWSLPKRFLAEARALGR